MSAGWLLHWIRARLPDRECIARHWQEDAAAFGKPQWFRRKQAGWGLVPVRWQGWAYAAAWSAIVSLPFVGLIGQHLFWEAGVWLLAAGSLLVWDIHQVRRALEPPPETEALAIEVPSAASSVTTRRFRLRGGRSLG